MWSHDNYYFEKGTCALLKKMDNGHWTPQQGPYVYHKIGFRSLLPRTFYPLDWLTYCSGHGLAMQSVLLRIKLGLSGPCKWATRN